MIWNYELEELKNGYKQDEKGCTCVICGERFEQGRLYQADENFYDAQGAARMHMKKAHGNMAEYLLSQELSLTGITEMQRNILIMMLAGKSDMQIAKEVGIANATVRNHRYKLREKEKQAKLLIALLSSVEEETKRDIAKSENGMIEEHHVSATMVDDRYNITEKDREQTIATYFDENGALRGIPARAKKKIIVLGEIVKNFKPDTEYSEHEVNMILRRIYEVDYITIRRSLIEYGFMDRSDDCTCYRVRE